MRFLSCFVHLLLLFTFPTVHLYSHTSYSKVDVDILSHQDHLTFDDLPRFDALLQLIDDIENGNLEQSRSKSINLEEIENIVIQLAREGMLPGEAKENAELENDIQSLLEGSFCHNCWFFSSRESYVIAPAIFYGQGELLLCRGWWQKKWEGLKKFIKKHKTAIIIGAAVILTAGAGIVLINAIAQENAKSASTREPPRSQPNKYLPEERSLPPSALTTPTSPAPIHEEDVRLLKETIEQEVIAFKEVLREGQMTETWQQSCKESARFASSFIAHDILNGIDEFCSISADLAAGLKKLAQLALPDSQLLHNGTSPVEDYEKAVAFAHEKIDQLFSTDLAKRYTPEAKAAQRQYAIENNINYMVLPPPAFINPMWERSKRSLKMGKKRLFLPGNWGSLSVKLLTSRVVGSSTKPSLVLLRGLLPIQQKSQPSKKSRERRQF